MVSFPSFCTACTPTITNTISSVVETASKVAREIIASIAVTCSLPAIAAYNYLSLIIAPNSNEHLTLSGTIVFWRSSLWARVYLAVSKCSHHAYDEDFLKACVRYGEYEQLQ